MLGLLGKMALILGAGALVLYLVWMGVMWVIYYATGAYFG